MSEAPDPELRKKLEQQFPFLADPFVSESMDMSLYTPEQKAAFRQYLGLREPAQDDDGLKPQIVANNRADLERFAREPGVLEELAQRDRGFAEEYVSRKVEEITDQFCARNEDYVQTDHNDDCIIQPMAKKYLGKDRLSNDEASRALFRIGKWSVQELEAQYRSCLKAGLLDIPEGKVKELTQAEKLDVVASIREGLPEVAVIRYLNHAFGGQLPYQFHSPREFMAAHPALCSRAALFVWQHNQLGLDPDAFAEFCRTRLKGTPILTYELIDKAWNDWCEQRRKGRLFEAVDNVRQRASEPEDLDSLSDFELNRRLNQAMRDAHRNRR